MAGIGAALDFGNQTAGGTYTIVGTSVGSGCSSQMSGSAVIVVNPLPVAYNVTGGGSYCSGGSGVHVMLSGSNTGINYQLKQDGTAVGLAMAGTGSALDFGAQTGQGTYTVEAQNSTTSCSNIMTGSVAININPLPTAYTVVGTGTSYCSGGAGIDIQLSNSQAGINYQLYSGSATTCEHSCIPGSGFDLDFGYQTGAGFYTVVAINPATGCTNTMTGGANVIVSPLPTAFTVTGGGGYYGGRCWCECWSQQF